MIILRIFTTLVPKIYRDNYPLEMLFMMTTLIVQLLRFRPISLFLFVVPYRAHRRTREMILSFCTEASKCVIFKTFTMTKAEGVVLLDTGGIESRTLHGGSSVLGCRFAFLLNLGLLPFV